MNKNQRLIIGPVLFGALFYILFHVFVFLSNEVAGEVDNKNDLHGFAAALLGLLMSPLLGLMREYIITGKVDSLTSIAYNPTRTEQEVQIWRQKWLALTMLGIIWIAISLYILAINTSIIAAATDETIIGAKIPKAVLEKFLITIGGSLYLGTYFPLVAASSFLCGYLAKEKIGYKYIIYPALLFYCAVNLTDYIQSGQLTVILAVEQAIKTNSESQHIASASAGDAALIWVLAAALFTLVTLAVAFYGWFWVKLGTFFRGRFS